MLCCNGHIPGHQRPDMPVMITPTAMVVAPSLHASKGLISIALAHISLG